jgi:hypothetical protein
MTTTTSHVPKKVNLFEDEGYDLRSSSCRHIVYKPIPLDQPLFDSVKQPNKILSLNLTQKHFRPGAVKWSDLEPEPLKLVGIWFNSLAFALDKKRRLTITAQEKKKKGEAQRKRKRVDSDAGDGVIEGVDEQSEVLQVEKEEQWIGGREFLTVHIETLFDEWDGVGTENFKVSGYRLWVFDGSSDKTGLDLLTKGLQECLLECKQSKNAQEERLGALNKAVGNGNGRKGFTKPVWELAPEFQYTTVYDDSLFINMVSGYCGKDDLLAQETQWDNANMEVEQDDDEVRAVRFSDNRTFLSYNRTDGNNYENRIGRDSNTLHTLFDKEQAMFYHVEYSKVRREQRSIASYCGQTNYEIESGLEQQHECRNNKDRLMDARTDGFQDKLFNRYPYPSTTYRIDSQDLSHDKIFRLPLPHHIGSYLYTTKDRDGVEERIKNATSEITPKPKRNLFGKVPQQSMIIEGDEEDDDLERLQPLGIHDTEYEITTDLLNLYSGFLTEEMKRHLNKGTNRGSIPADLRTSFLSIIKNDIQKELMAIENDLLKKKDYFVEKMGGQVKNKPNPTPTLNEYNPSIGNNKYTCTTYAHLSRNKEKQHGIDRRVFSEIGGDSDAILKEKNKYLSSVNLAYARSIIRKYRPVDATIENALACGGGLMYDPVLMGRNIYQIMAVLNKFGYAAIDRQFYDPKTRKVRRGQLAAYCATKRAYLEAITVEFFEEFRTSTLVSNANVGIRSDLFGGVDGIQTNPKKRYVGINMPVSKFNIQVRPYHFYKLWVYSYFTEHDGINHYYKTMDVLFHARYHHCRSYPPGCKDPKGNVLLSGQNAGGKSHRLQATKDACPTGVSEGITHLSNQAFNVGQNMDDMLIVNEEVSNKLISPATGKGGSSEAANDDVRNNFKERATGGMTSSLIFETDEVTGQRKARLHKCSCQSVILGATNNDLSESDPNVISRFIVISMPRSKNEIIGNRPIDKDKLEVGKDENKSIVMQEQVREVHRLYYIIECLLNSGVLGNTFFGINIDGGRTYIYKVLDLMYSKYGIQTGDTRKRKHVVEMARCMTISYACWFGLTSPTTRHLFYDPYTKEYIGLNPRVILDGILPYLVMTKDMAINAITSLSCLWGHEYMDKILEHITKNICNLDKLKPSDFLRRPKSDLFGPNSNITATNAFTAPFVEQNARGRRGGGGGVDDANGIVEMDTDYNYVTISGKTHAKIYELLSNSLGELCVAPNDIGKILKDLAKNTIQTDSYVPVLDPDDPNTIEKLVRSKDANRNIPRAIVDLYKSPTTGLYTIAISVAFLKQKLPHILDDEIIEDLSNLAYKPTLQEGSDDLNVGGGGRNKDRDAEEFGDIRRKIMNAMTIRPGSVSEICAIKAIRDIMENDMLERNPNDTEKDEQANYELYRDVFTGAIPWHIYPTSEHPQSILISSLFPHISDQYAKVAGFNKEVLLVDKISVIELERKKGGMPLVHYNYNTVSPSAQSCLSVYGVIRPKDGVDNSGGYDDDDDDFEVTPLRDEDGKASEYVERGNEVTKNQFHMYSAHPVFKIDRDIDYVSCDAHLRHICYPVKRVKNRLVNYPPHTYMDLVDNRRSQKRPVDLVPLYDDVLQRVDATRRIIEAQVGIIAEDTPLFADLYVANYEKEDLEREAEEMEVIEINQEQVAIREFQQRKSEINGARRTLLSANSHYNMGQIGDIVSSLGNISAAGNKSKARRPTKRTKVV